MSITTKMDEIKITEAQIKEKSISSLPTRPNAPVTSGGQGFTPAALRARFDALPKLIAARFNALLEYLSADFGADDGSIADIIQTGLEDLPTLAALFAAVRSGLLADKLLVDGRDGNLVDLQSFLNSLVHIPAVTADDEGKFLRVDGGKWAAVEIPYAEKEEY